MDETSNLIAEADRVAQQAATTAVPPGGVGQAAWWSTRNAMTMSCVVLTFGIVILAISAWLLRAGHSATSVLRVFGTLLIIVMVTFLVVAGYDDKQIAAPLGLMGTIVGYLLGREVGRDAHAKD